MSQLKFGDVTLEGEVFQTRAQAAGRSVPALELRLAGAADETALRAMEENDLVILDENGEEAGRETGYRRVMRRSVVLARVMEAEEALILTSGQLRAAQAENARLEEENAKLLYAMLTGEEG